MMAFSEVQSKINSWLMEKESESATQQAPKPGLKTAEKKRKRQKWEDS